MAIQASDGVVFRNLSGEAVLLNLATGIYFGLNETGTRMWTLLLETGNKEKTIATLKREYDADEPRLREDLDQLVHQLSEKGLLKEESEVHAPKS